MIRILAVALLAVVVLPDAADACSVCFGDPESPQGRGLNAAVWTLMGTTLSVLGAAAAFFITMALRARRARQEDEGELGEMRHA